MRSWKISKYIMEFGWEPIIISSDPGLSKWGSPLPNIKVYRIKNRVRLEEISTKIKSGFVSKNSSKNESTLNKASTTTLSYKYARTLKHILSEFIVFPDMYSDWRKKALKLGREVLKKEKIDIIMSTSGPFSSHCAASILAKEFDIPWVADYRDLYSQNPIKPNIKWRKLIDKKFERFILGEKSTVVTVSEPLSLKLENILKRKVHTITNGFDPEDFKLTCPTDTVFSITYTGILYEGKRDPTPLFKAIRLLLDKNKIKREKIQIHFYGSDERYLRSTLEGKEIDDIVYLHESIPFEESTKRQQMSSILLFLNWNDPQEKGQVSGKIFEYLGAHRPILAFPRNEDSAVDKIIEKTQAGVICSTIEEIAKKINEWYDEFYDFGNISYKGIEEEIQKYSRKNQAKDFADLFNEIIGKNSF